MQEFCSVEQAMDALLKHCNCTGLSILRLLIASDDSGYQVLTRRSTHTGHKKRQCNFFVCNIKSYDGVTKLVHLLPWSICRWLMCEAGVQIGGNFKHYEGN